MLSVPAKRRQVPDCPSQYGEPRGKLLTMTRRRSQSTVSAVEFIGKLIKLLEEGEPFTLAPYQRRVLEMLLRRDPSGKLAFPAGAAVRAQDFIAAYFAIE